MADKHILVVDDDKRLRELLERYLEQNGFKVSSAKDAIEARTMLDKSSYDLLVVDVMMPGESGMSLTQSIKEENDVPILMLTAMGESEDRIKGLESGADDYLVKPFEPRELCLRIEKLIKRAAGSKRQGRVKFGPYVFNQDTGDLRRGDTPVPLTSKELAMLSFLAKHLNEPVSRETLSQALNGISERSIDVQINRLRRKIEENPSFPNYLEAVWGKGYILRSRED